MKAEYKQIRYGQDRPYGDSYAVYEIITDCQDRDEVIKFCKEVIMKGRDIYDRYNRPDSFSSYYELAKTNSGWQFTMVYPYDD